MDDVESRKVAALHIKELATKQTFKHKTPWVREKVCSLLQAEGLDASVVGRYIKIGNTEYKLEKNLDEMVWQVRIMTWSYEQCTIV